MHPQITFAVIFNAVIAFIAKGLPILIGLASLFRLLAKANSDQVTPSQCLPNLIVILACIAFLAMTWSSALCLALVCVTIIIMNKLKPE